MRRLLVNAQVTAMVSLLEAVSSIVYVIIVLFALRTTYTTLLQIMTVYLVLSPYLFLMNTSHNKNRVVEHGWKNVFKNLLGMKKDTTICTETLSTLSKGIEDMSDCHRKHPKDKNDLKIFTTVSSGTISDSHKYPAFSKLAWVEEQPSTSNGYYGPKELCLGFIRPDLKEQPKKNSEKTTVSHLMISKMIKHIDEEERYLEYFKRLLAYRHDVKAGIVPLEYSCYDEVRLNCTTYEKSKKKISKGKSKLPRKERTLLQSKNKLKSVLEDQITEDVFNQGMNSSADRNHRTLIRVEILNQIISCNDKDAIYDSLVEYLIDVEENFV